MDHRPRRFAKTAGSDGDDATYARRLIHQSLEGGGLVDGQIGQDLAVDLDAGAGEPADKSAVGQAVLAARRR